MQDGTPKDLFVHSPSHISLAHAAAATYLCPAGHVTRTWLPAVSLGNPESPVARSLQLACSRTQCTSSFVGEGFGRHIFTPRMHACMASVHPPASVRVVSTAQQGLDLPVLLKQTATLEVGCVPACRLLACGSVGLPGAGGLRAVTPLTACMRAGLAWPDEGLLSPPHVGLRPVALPT